MIYPKNFENKIGFDEVRRMLSGYCSSRMGREQAENLAFTNRAEDINESLEQVREMRMLIQEEEAFPQESFPDVRASVQRIRIENTHLEEEELAALVKTLENEGQILSFVRLREETTPEEIPAVPWAGATYPALYALADGVADFPDIVRKGHQILDEDGKVCDNASPVLKDIRTALARARGNISKTLYHILHSAQNEGVVEKDVTPAIRDGRLVIPIAPSLKRKIRGIVHDESATGKTVFIEPDEVVEANNHVRELESQERQEVIRILTEITKHVRPHVREILDACRFLGIIDLLLAKVSLGRTMKGIEPNVENSPVIDWIQARHPLLERSLAEKKSRPLIPLDITLDAGNRILVISGPNAGGKSVCLKTVGLLQYMLQCGLPIPVDERSKAGVFSDIMIDIGDEQSLENDLSTYSSHLLHMKNMMKQADGHTLILIDEFGSGTEPQIGGAIAESVLNQFLRKGAWGVITTHYQNLKHFADAHTGVVNGAMLYDRHEMRPLFQLAIGRPGSSFAIEIARKTGLPEEVIQEASEIVGSDYIQSDKYLQDIVRDKRYWEGKRQEIRRKEKELENTISKYENGLQEVEEQRKAVIRKAQEEAAALLEESNRKIENAIKAIRESQAEKETTKKIRQDLDQFREGLAKTKEDDRISREIERIRKRRERHEKRKTEQTQNRPDQTLVKAPVPAAPRVLMQGDSVRIKGLTEIGRIERLEGKTARVTFGGVHTMVNIDKLEYADTVKEPQEATQEEALAERLQATSISRTTRETIDARRSQFHQDLDIRGMRGDEALNAVQRFIDDAILIGMPRVRILHGKGNGILRQLVRQYLSTVPNVTQYADEQVQFGGAGITVADLE